MRTEIVEMKNVRLVGISRDIPYARGPELCPQFWAHYVERIVKPVFMEKRQPDALQRAAIRNHVGSLALCQCALKGVSCSGCCQEKFTAAGQEGFTYVIGGLYEGGEVPEGMSLYPLHEGKWIKFHFTGGMAAFQQQARMVYQEYLPQHPQIKADVNQSLEWYEGEDIQSPDYQCGVMLPLD